MSSATLPSNELITSIHEDYCEFTDLRDFSKLLTKIEREIILNNAETKPKPITARHLVYLSKHANDKYKAFTLPKKSGGTRNIEAPDPFLKRVQKTINTLFQILFHEKINHHANGFILKRSINRNALPHVQKRFVLNIDIKNFFPSIEFRRVKTVLEFAPFNLTDQRESIGFIISNICCLNGRLPQGAPTSPILSNIVTQRLDRKMARLALKHRVKYSRYADDLSFSANRNAFKSDFLDEVHNLMQEENFILNEDKTRVKSNRDHQEVTGIVVNEKLNVKRSYLKTVRTMLNNWEKGGLVFAESQLQFNEPHKILNDFKNVLGGRIGYIGQIRGKGDPLYQRLNLRFRLLKHQINYEKITDERVKKSLVRDNEKMEKIPLDNIHNSEYMFISFCTSAFHQIENLTNYYYWKKFPFFEDLLKHLLSQNPAFGTRYKTLDHCKRFKRIRDLDINVLIYLIEKEFYFDKGIPYRQEITMLRDIRNDDSHRCEIDRIDQNSTIEKYEQLKTRWNKHKEKTGQFTKKNEEEIKIEYDYRLIQFYNEKKWNVVRKTLKKLAIQIQEQSG